MANIQKTIGRPAFMVMLVALLGIVLLGFPNQVSAQRQVAPYYPHGGGSYQPYYPHGGGGYGGGRQWGGGYSGYRGGYYGGRGYSSYRGGGHGLWWIPLAIIGGAVALVVNSVAVVSNSLAPAPNYYAPNYSPYYAAPPAYVQPAPSVPPGSYVYPR